MSQYYFDTEHAKLYGVNEAIIINNFIYWIKKNKAEDRNFHDGRTWSYMPITGFEEWYEYLSKKQIRTILSRLIDTGILITGNYNSNPHDRTLWYAFVDECIFLKGQMEMPKRANGDAQKGKCITTNNPSNDISCSEKIQNGTDFKIIKFEITKESTLEEKIIKNFHSLFCAFRTKPGKPFTHKTLLSSKMGEWAKELDAIMRIDKRTREDLLEVYDFLKKGEDKFWRETISSLGGIRKHYDKISDKMSAEKEKKKGKPAEAKEGVFQGNINRVTKSNGTK